MFKAINVSEAAPPSAAENTGRVKLTGSPGGNIPFMGSPFNLIDYCKPALSK